MKPSEGQITIPLSEAKIVLLTLGSVAFVAFGFWIWFNADSQTRHSPEFARLTATICIAFFGLCGVSGFIKLFDTKPGLIISKEGIFDNTSSTSVGWIKWEDIDGFEIAQIKHSKFLVISVHDQTKYLDALNPLKKLMMKMNSGMIGSPFAISSHALSCKFSHLVELLESNFQKHRSQPAAPDNGDKSSSLS